MSQNDIADIRAIVMDIQSRSPIKMARFINWVNLWNDHLSAASKSGIVANNNESFALAELANALSAKITGQDGPRLSHDETAQLIRENAREPAHSFWEVLLEAFENRGKGCVV